MCYIKKEFKFSLQKIMDFIRQNKVATKEKYISYKRIDPFSKNGLKIYILYVRCGVE